MTTFSGMVLVVGVTLKPHETVYTSVVENNIGLSPVLFASRSNVVSVKPVS